MFDSVHDQIMIILLQSFLLLWLSNFVTFFLYISILVFVLALCIGETVLSLFIVTPKNWVASCFAESLYTS